MPRPRLLTATSFAIVLLASGCDDLGRFDTAPGEAYCGQITLGGGYRTGFSPRVQMRLTLDVDALQIGETGGTMTTYDAGLETGQHLLDGAPLRRMTALAHDPLSDLEFGEGRDKNFVLAVSPSDVDAESLIVGVSLRSDDQVGVRLLRPGTADSDDNARSPLFGVFLLSRRDDGCGF